MQTKTARLIHLLLSQPCATGDLIDSDACVLAASLSNLERRKDAGLSTTKQKSTRTLYRAQNPEVR